MFIGDRLKKWRKERDISLTNLSEMTGIQIATLSRIENKKMIGTLESHIQIAKALKVDITDLYRDLQSSSIPETPNQQPQVVFNEHRLYHFEILSQDPLNKMMLPALIHLKAGASTPKEQNKMNTERFLYAIKGNAFVNIEKNRYHLKHGTSIYFNASLEHSIHNESKDNIIVLSVTTPPAL